MATKEEKENTGVSRREFLKNAKLLAGSVAGGMAIANLAAAGTPGDENKAKEIQIQGSTVKVPEPVYEVYNTDIL
ncbi:MAG: hypothetical protein KJ882_04140, partial [Proteobacteria bacterium]|nr:hypothetical protein [Pseudomonadota bacterium]